MEEKINIQVGLPLILSHRGHYVRIEPLFQKRDFSFDDKLVFILMPFSAPWSDRIWEKLFQIVTNLGLRAERADNRYGPVITEDIWAGIVESRLIICDVTGWNPNVFYELGVAHTIGKEVILITQPVTPFPFDTQGLRHMIYTDNPAGMRLLEEELPKVIEYYLQQAPKIKRARLKLGFLKPKKEALRRAWGVATNNWEPKLPPQKYGKERGHIGILKSKMMSCVWELGGEEIGNLLKEVRGCWPQSWDEMDEAEIKQKCTDLKGLVAKMEAKSYAIKYNLFMPYISREER